MEMNGHAKIYLNGHHKDSNGRHEENETTPFGLKVLFSTPVGLVPVKLEKPSLRVTPNSPNNNDRYRK